MKNYSVTLITNSGRSHRFKWSCNEADLGSRGNVYDLFMQLPYIKVKDTEKTDHIIRKEAIAELIFTEKAEKY